MKKPDPTPQQDAAVKARGKVIVSASAGSGKTFVMIERLVSLIAEGTDVGNILAVTFTTKAAAQMRDRARKKLIERYLTADDALRPHLKRQIDDLPAADICTVHSFCGKLLRTYFYLIGIDPRFRIAGESAEGAEVKARALDETMETAFTQDEPWFRRLLAAYFRKGSDRPLRENVLSLYAEARNIANYREKLEEELRRTPEEAFAALKETALSLCREEAQAFAEEAAALLKEEGFLTHLSEGVPAVIAMREWAQRVLAADVKDAEALSAGPDCTVPRRDRRLPDRQRYVNRLYAYRDRCAAIAGRLGKLSADDAAFPPFANAKETADALIRLVLDFDARYFAEKKANGVLDYDDLEHLSLAVLSDEEVRRAVREKYRYLFVDEYQDINPLQNAILEAVAGEDVFFVGDKKQAIYGFRGSRAKFFTEQEQALGGALRLDKNFRSAPTVLDAVNRVFAHEMKDYIPMTGGERFREKGDLFLHEVALPDEPAEAPSGVYSVKDHKEKARTNALAEAVLTVVRGELGTMIYDADKDKMRPVTYRDIAILVREQTETTLPVLRRISESGIPITAAAKVNICDFFDVQLLLDWLSYLDNGEQDIPLVSAMVSAAGGFTDGDLASIRLKTGGFGSFRAACTAYQKREHDALAEKLKAFFAYSERLRTLARIKTAPEILSVLLADGLEAQIAASGGNEALARTARLTSEAEGLSVHAFLKQVKDGGGKIVMEAGRGGDAVIFSTMHASKGLEYPVVILLNLATNFRRTDGKKEVLWAESLGPAPRCFDFENKKSANTLARDITVALINREEEEGDRNLLYVAMTRAQNRLHLMLQPKGKSRCFLDMLRPEELECLASPWSPAESGEEAPAPDASSAEKMTAGIVGALAPYPFPKSVLVPVKDSATGLLRRDRTAFFPPSGSLYTKEEGEEPEEDDYESADARAEGLAYHAFLEHVDFAKSAQEELTRMRREGVLTQAQLSLLDEARLARILAIPALASLAGKQTWREQRFLVSLPAGLYYDADENGDVEVVFQGALDLLALDEKGYHIIDYKFSSHEDDVLKRDYAPQMSLYRRAVAAIKKVAEDTIRVTVINIKRGREIIF